MTVSPGKFKQASAPCKLVLRQRRSYASYAPWVATQGAHGARQNLVTRGTDMHGKAELVRDVQTCTATLCDLRDEDVRQTVYSITNMLIQLLKQLL